MSAITTPPGPPLAPGMSWVPGGSFLMGSEDFYPEERPVHRVEVDGFWMDEAPVTAGEYRRFVKESGYVTVAERPLDPDLYPHADPELLVPGSLVFRKTSGPVDLGDVRNWWEYVPGAYWKRPGGPKTSINGRVHLDSGDRGRLDHNIALHAVASLKRHSRTLAQATPPSRG